MKHDTPFFFAEEITTASKEFILNEETSRHIVQVLRMQKGERLQLTNGKGNVFNVEIISEHKKAAKVSVISTSEIVHPASNITIAISLIKNSSRFEWFAEKATEIGVSAIMPLLCERTEKQHFRVDRMKAILTSAMLQSQQAWLPLLSEPLSFKEFIKQPYAQQKYIAHCIDEDRKELVDYCNGQPGDHLILIGPEGDFTKEEINAALQNNFITVSLGKNRLRTETAGVVAVALLNAR